MRLTSDFWVSALLRQVRGQGGFAYLTRRGAGEAGTIFIQLRHGDGTVDLFGPAPQSFYEDDIDKDERFFIRLLNHVEEDHSVSKLEKELRFDADLWLVEIEDFEGQNLPFLCVKETQ